MGKIEDIGTYPFRKDDMLLFDANVWLYIYYFNDPNDRRSRVYSRAFHEIRRAGSSIFIDALVLSEVVGRMAKAEYEKRLSVDRGVGSFKAFRDSSAFCPISAAISQDARRILGQCQCCDSAFPDLNVAGLLDAYADGGKDFGDMLIASLCAEKQLSLVTHDRDFADANVHILTSNKRLLAP